MMPRLMSHPDSTRHERQEVRCIPPKSRKVKKFPRYRKRQAIVKMGTRPPRWLKCPRKSTIIAGIQNFLFILNLCCCLQCSCIEEKIFGVSSRTIASQLRLLASQMWLFSNRKANQLWHSSSSSQLASQLAVKLKSFSTSNVPSKNKEQLAILLIYNKFSCMCKKLCRQLL